MSIIKKNTSTQQPLDAHSRINNHVIHCIDKLMTNRIIIILRHLIFARRLSSTMVKAPMSGFSIMTSLI